MQKAIGNISGLANGKRLSVDFEIETKTGKTIDLINAVFNYAINQVERFDQLAKVSFKIVKVEGVKL